METPENTVPQSEGVAATAPAPAVAASEHPNEPAPKKTGLLARLLGSSEKAEELEGQLTAEKAAHAETQKQLAAANAELAEFKALEARLEKEAAEAKAQAEQAAQAKSEAEAEKAKIPAIVSQQVAGVVESLGVPDAALPQAQAEPPKKGEDFSHLKGVARAAAAFAAQIAGK